jgi:hypothetical protein
MVTLAQGELEAAQRDWERIIGDANAAAANVMIAADGQAYAAYSRFMQAQNNFSAASTELQTAELEFAAAEKRQATALIGAAADLASNIGAGNSVRCSANDVGGGAGAVYWVDGATNVLRHYPNPEIATSWDPDWGTTTQDIDCIGFVKGDDMPKNPVVVAAEAFAARVADLGDGNPVSCDTADVGAGPGAVYRTTGTTTLRHYPNPTIATSWDPDWGTTTQGIDCTGFVLGDDMEMEPNAARDAVNAAIQAVNDAFNAERLRLAGIVRGYKHPNLTGEMLEMTTSGNEKGAVGNDHMSSIYVPEGHWAQLFEHHDYGGWCKAYGPGTHNLASRENDDMTSYKIGTGSVPACPSSGGGGAGDLIYGPSGGGGPAGTAK